MLWHACGYKLGNDGYDTRSIQAYLGHRNIQNTARYTALAPQRAQVDISVSEVTRGDLVVIDTHLSGGH
jgi:site-specific recombinase XerD